MAPREAIMNLKGTISDFDRAGLFGLIIADDDRLLLFNLRDTPAALRNRFQIGMRVEITRHSSAPTARAIEFTPID
jgi:hypothetical protein